MMDQMGVPPAAPQGRSNRMLIAVVAGVLVVCCCCVLLSLPALWSCGDVLMGIATECAPLF